jgi:hypothetical protein
LPASASERPSKSLHLAAAAVGRYSGSSTEIEVPRDPKITPITRHEPRTFYATRVTRTQAGESWDLWSVEDGRRIGFLSVVDDGHVVYALATVKRGTSHEEVADLVEGFFTPSSTDAHNREIIISDYDEEPEMLESDIRQS